MRWIVLALVFIAGIALGVFLASPRSNDLVEAPPAADVRSREQSVPSVDTLVNRRDFEALVIRLAGDFDAYQRAVADLSPDQQVIALDAWREAHGETLRAAVLKARQLVAASRADEAVAWLLETAVLVGGPGEREAFEGALADAVDAEARRLTAEGRLSELDSLYEQITLALPELSVYFLKLGTLRVQTGQDDGALAVLSQIQNHPRFGESARSLLATAESDTQSLPARLETLPLTRRGDQFVVEASLDDGARVALLIDTGASMTVVSRQFLEARGYTIAGPTAWFATAGGVVEGPVITVPRLALGRASVRQLSVGVLPVDFPDEIDGLLGMNFLRHFEFQIDQENAELRLNPG